jgi:hypothetical protein
MNHEQPSPRIRTPAQRSARIHIKAKKAATKEERKRKLDEEKKRTLDERAERLSRRGRVPPTDPK